MLAWKNVSEMTCFVLVGCKTLTQSIKCRQIIWFVLYVFFTAPSYLLFDITNWSFSSCESASCAAFHCKQLVSCLATFI